MTGFAHIRKVIVPVAATAKTQDFLRAVGRRGDEGLVLWCGKAGGDVFHVTNILIPHQRAVRTADGLCALVAGDELHRINVELYESGLRIIAQIHSHPADAFHSDTDDGYAIANTVGALSLVVPEFAARDFALNDCAIYRLTATGAWKELSLRDAKALIEIRTV